MINILSSLPQICPFLFYVYTESTDKEYGYTKKTKFNHKWTEKSDNIHISLWAYNSFEHNGMNKAKSNMLSYDD